MGKKEEVKTTTNNKKTWKREKGKERKNFTKKLRKLRKFSEIHKILQGL